MTVSQRVGRWVVTQWHQPTFAGQCLLQPLAWLFAVVSGLRRSAYRCGLRRSERLSVPVIVVGNLTVGGSGKTPLVAAIVARLQAAGWSPGAVSRGYGGQIRSPARLPAAADPAQFGDEPVWLAAHTGRPVAVGARRPEAARLLLPDCDVIVADDGLQHYRLARDLEIAVIDGDAGLGNGRLLPAGPLREPPRRLRSVDYVAVRDGEYPGAWRYRVSCEHAVRLTDGKQAGLATWRGQPVHAVAAIGVPERFFGQLEDLGLTIERHGFADHHAFEAGDFRFDDPWPVLMTEKDAVKCRAFADSRMWAVTAGVDDIDGIGISICERLNAMGRTRGPSTA